MLVLVFSVTSCSLLGLVSVGPFAGDRHPLGHRAARPRAGDGSAGITPPWTTTSRLTPRRALVCLSQRVIASPTRSPPIRRPGHTWTTGHLLCRHDVVCENCTGPCEVSRDYLVNVFATARRHYLRRPLRPRSFLDDEGSAASLNPGRSPRSAGLTPVHSRSSLWLCLRPLRTPRHRDALGIGY